MTAAYLDKLNPDQRRAVEHGIGGADPRALLIIAGALGSSAAASAPTWSGTFHSIGARLLREYAGEIGLSPSFTIHDRGDAADLMNLVRHELGFSKTKS